MRRTFPLSQRGREGDVPAASFATVDSQLLDPLCDLYVSVVGIVSDMVGFSVVEPAPEVNE